MQVLFLNTQGLIMPQEKKHSKPLPLKGIKILEVCTLVLGLPGPGILARLSTF